MPAAPATPAMLVAAVSNLRRPVLTASLPMVVARVYRRCSSLEGGHQRLEYWGRLRALRSPTFLRSTVRASRVIKPAPRNAPRRVSS